MRSRRLSSRPRGPARFGPLFHGGIHIPILELCAGYGGIGRAVEALTGERIRYVAEVDPYASLILANRYPHAPNLGDITTYDWSTIAGEVDIITAGFPCQDISNAGRRAGIHGERSGIWESVLGAIRVLRPRLVFLENVSAIRNRGLAHVLAGLAEARYDTRWCCHRASDVGAAHHRDRWFLIASPTPHPSGIRRHEGAGLREG
ncbi:DNA cytosine methyltransferase [Streptomyces sp. NPDC093105]|uniref:DNA cytosine methyltransferase n=1 Tax=Streptomyces sp. NPDC093105 TaxID=3366029 RepID=UPI0037FC4278